MLIVKHHSQRLNHFFTSIIVLQMPETTYIYLVVNSKYSLLQNECLTSADRLSVHKVS